MQFIPVMRSWIFSIITPVFSVTWSSEIILIWWFAALETCIIIIIKVKKSLMNKKSKEQHFAEERKKSFSYTYLRKFSVYGRHSLYTYT